MVVSQSALYEDAYANWCDGNANIFENVGTLVYEIDDFFGKVERLISDQQDNQDDGGIPDEGTTAPDWLGKITLNLDRSTWK